MKSLFILAAAIAITVGSVQAQDLNANFSSKVTENLFGILTIEQLRAKLRFEKSNPGEDSSWIGHTDVDLLRGTITNNNPVSVKFDSVSTAVKVIVYDAKQQPVSEAYADVYDDTGLQSYMKNMGVHQDFASGSYIKAGQTLTFRVELTDPKSEIRFTKIIVAGASTGN